MDSDFYTGHWYEKPGLAIITNHLQQHSTDSQTASKYSSPFCPWQTGSHAVSSTRLDEWFPCLWERVAWLYPWEIKTHFKLFNVLVLSPLSWVYPADCLFYYQTISKCLTALLPCHVMLSRITTCFHPYVITKNGSPCSFVVLEDLIFNFQPKPMHHVLQY